MLNVEIAEPRVRDERLRAVDDPLAVLETARSSCTSAASEPAPGSVSANPPSASPRASGASHRSLCSSVPNRFSMLPASPIAADSVMATDWSTRPSSSSARHTVTASASDPPYRLGERQPEQPEVAHLLHDVQRELLLQVGLGRARRDTSFGELTDDARGTPLVRRSDRSSCRPEPLDVQDGAGPLARTTASTRRADLPWAVAEQPMHQDRVGVVEPDEPDRRRFVQRLAVDADVADRERLERPARTALRCRRSAPRSIVRRRSVQAGT